MEGRHPLHLRSFTILQCCHTYRRLKEAAPGEVGWEEVMHWMWPLFTDRWASWRTHRLHLSACPLTDPVTELPLLHEWPRASPLLYGFSPQVVECPAYWPRSVNVCGFWFAPLEWEVRDANSELMTAAQGTDKGSSNPRRVLLDPIGRHSLIHTSSLPETIEATGDGGTIQTQDHPELTEVLNERTRSLDNFQVEPNSQLDVSIDDMKKTSYEPPVKLARFISDHRDSRPIFVGMSSMGSMGFLPKPDFILRLLEAILEATKSSAILLTAGHPPLDLAVSEQCDERLSIHSLDAEQRRNLVREGLHCFHGRLFCYSGSVPYAWLLPECSVAIHHGGSGTTAACLRAGIPQIICPFVLDQFYWAERMTWLGVAPQPLMTQHLMPASEELLDAVKVVTTAIREAASVEMKRCACAMSAKIEDEDGTAVAVGILRVALCR